MTFETVPAFEGKIVSSHALTVRLDQLEDGSINYTVTPDDEVVAGRELGFMHHALSGAPMVFLAIMALGNKLMNQTIIETLNAINEASRQWVQIANGLDEAGSGQPSVEDKILH
jgi:hypothetical protein